MTEVSFKIEDMKCWPFNGFAPGGYRHVCNDCGRHFVGDKRATSCLECAINGARLGKISTVSPLVRGLEEKSPIQIIFAPNGGCALQRLGERGCAPEFIGAYSSIADMLDDMRLALGKTLASKPSSDVFNPENGHQGPG